MHSIEAFLQERTRFPAFFDPDAPRADVSRDPVIFADTRIPPMWHQAASTPVADYITKDGNRIGAFPVERAAELTVRLVQNYLQLDKTILPAVQEFWPSKEAPSPEMKVMLKDAQKFLFGGMWVARDFVLQILRDFEIAGQYERQFLHNRGCRKLLC